LLSLLTDAETGQRGYLLTGDTGYLADYRGALPKIGRSLPALTRMPAAGAEDRKRLSALIAAKLDELAQTVRIRQQGDIASALAVVHAGHGNGKQTMDEIRVVAAR
jgi:CHASE3 domain sensor protein